MSSAPVTIRPVETKKDRKAFVDFAWEVYKDDPAWVPPLKDEVHGLITPGKNPWFEHARAQLWLAERERQGRRTHQRAGRRSGAGAHGRGHRTVGHVRSARRRSCGGPDRDRRGLAAEARDEDARSGPISLSIWDEPGLEIEGFAEPPTVMMGHHRPEYRRLDRGRGLREGQGPRSPTKSTSHIGTTEDRPPDRNGREQPAASASARSTSRSSTRKRGSSSTCSTTPGRQLGLCPADRGRDRLCRQEAEADHLSTSWCGSPNSTANRSPS